MGEFEDRESFYALYFKTKLDAVGCKSSVKSSQLICREIVVNLGKIQNNLILF